MVPRQSSFQEGTGINAGRRMGLEENQVGSPFRFRLQRIAMEKVIETHLEQVCHRRIARKVAPEFSALFIGANDHRQGVPTHNGRYFPL